MLVECWQSLGSTASNCGKGLPKVLQQLRQGFSAAAVGFRCSARWLTAARVPVLGSVAVRPAVPARRLPFLPVVLCKGCPCCPVGVPVSVAAFGRASFGGGAARLGSVAFGQWLWVRCLVLVRVAPFPFF